MSRQRIIGAVVSVLGLTGICISSYFLNIQNTASTETMGYITGTTDIRPQISNGDVTYQFWIEYNYTTAKKQPFNAKKGLVYDARYAADFAKISYDACVPCLTKVFYDQYSPTRSDLSPIPADQNVVEGCIAVELVSIICFLIGIPFAVCGQLPGLVQ